ncbi:putative G-protein coupled receptor 160 [Amia ocellicauda]|uniref:putative G-protein coupled receptor 160 n=1 Tax=Amia ocellicauda TaxID=2972642 RepID=UPI0034638CCF
MPQMAVSACQNCSEGLQSQQETADPLANTISSLLLVLAGKGLLNWALVLLKRGQVNKSFLGYFCISLTLIDTLLILIFSLIYFLEDFCLLGFRFTKYHICTLVQVACFTYEILHWPVFLLTGLDYYCTLSSRHRPLHWAWKLTYILSVAIVWILALLYVFLASNFYPEVWPSFHLLLFECFISTSFQSFCLSLGLLMVLSCALLYCIPEIVLYCFIDHGKSISGEPMWTLTQSKANPESKQQVLFRVTVCFLSTWFPFVCLQLAILLLRAEIPAYLDMNVPWLCFLNSFLIGAVYWLQYQVFKVEKGILFPDGFCNWNCSTDPRDTMFAPDYKALSSSGTEDP